jgi:hypothetical protein
MVLTAVYELIARAGLTHMMIKFLEVIGPGAHILAVSCYRQPSLENYFR